MANNTPGLKAISKDLANMQEGAAVAVLALVGGASKAQAAWAGFSQFFVLRVLGPVGLFASTALGATLALNKLGRAFADMGMESAKQMEQMTGRFKPLLGGIESAKARMSELAKFAASTPFELPGVVEANQTLQSLTKGALATKEGMKLVGDAATVAGTPMEDMAVKIGRLYDGLQSGRPVGEVALHLQELGVISGSTRNQLEAMQEAGRAGSDVWKVAADDIGRASGAMVGMMASAKGLETNLNDAKNAFQRAFANNYMEGEKAMVKATADAYANLTPVITEVGAQISYVSNIWEKFKAYIIESVSGSTIFQGTIVALGVALTTLFSAITAVSAAMGGKFIIDLVRGATAAGDAAQGYMLIAESAKLAAVAVKEKAAGDALAAGIAADFSIISAKEGYEMVRTAGVAGTLGAAIKGVWSVGKSLAAMFVEMTSAVIFNPFVLLAAALIGVAVAIKSVIDSQRAMQAELDNANDAIKESIMLLDRQRSAIKTVAELHQMLAAELAGVAAAEAHLQDVRTKSALAPNDENLKKQVEIAQRGVAEHESSLKKTLGVKVSNLETGPNQEKLGDKLARNREIAASQFSADLEQMSPEGRISALKEHGEKLAALAKEHDESGPKYQKNQQDMVFLGAARGDADAQMAALVTAKKTLEEPVKKPSEGNPFSSDGGGHINASKDANAGEASRVAALKDTNDQIATLKKTIESMPDEAKKLDDILKSGDAITILQAKIAVVDELTSANDSLKTSEAAYSDAVKESNKAKEDGGDEKVKAAADKLATATAAVEHDKRRISMATGNASRVGIDPAEGPRVREDSQQAINDHRKEIEAAHALLQANKERIAQEQRLLDLAGKTEDYETAKKQAELDNMGPLNTEYALKVKMLGIESKRLDQLAKDGVISQSQLAHGKASLAIEQKMLDIATRRSATMAINEGEAGHHAAIAAWADQTGDPEGGVASRNAQREEELKNKNMEIEDYAKSHFAPGKDHDDYVKRAQETAMYHKTNADDADAKQLAARNFQTDSDTAKKTTEGAGATNPGETEYQTKKKLIDLEAKELEFKRINGSLSEKELENGLKQLAIQDKMLDYEHKRAEARSKLAQSSSKSSIDEEDDNFHGRSISAQHDRKRKRASDRAQRELDLQDEAKSTFRDPNDMRKHVKEGLNQFDRETKAQTRGEGLGGAREALNKVAEGWIDFLMAFKELMDKVREYKSNLKVKELRATGKDEDSKEADKIESQKAYEARVKEVVKDTGTNGHDAARYVNREMKADHDGPINKKLAELNEQLVAKQKEVADDLAHPKREYQRGPVIASSMSRLGGGMAFSSNSFYKTDGQKAHQDMEDVKKLLKQINDAASDSYVVHSMRPPVVDKLSVWSGKGQVSTVSV